jgi:hypothetical protein
VTDQPGHGWTFSIFAAAFAAFFYVEPSTVVWALIGSYFGAAGGPQQGPLRSIVQYILASFISALLATVAMLWFAHDIPLVRCALAVGVAVGFYSIKQHFGEQIGGFVAAIMGAWRARLGLKQPEEPK